MSISVMLHVISFNRGKRSRAEHYHRRRRQCDSSAALGVRCPRSRLGSHVAFACAVSRSSVLMLHSAASKLSVSASSQGASCGKFLCHSSCATRAGCWPSHMIVAMRGQQRDRAFSASPTRGSVRSVAGLPAATTLAYADFAVFSRALCLNDSMNSLRCRSVPEQHRSSRRERTRGSVCVLSFFRGMMQSAVAWKRLRLRVGRDT